MTDPIADLLIRIKNAFLSRHESLEVPYSSLKERLAKLLVQEGYLKKVEILGQKPTEKKLKIELEYKGKRGAISDLRRVSKPGRRIYITVKKIPYVQGGRGMAVISTPKGLMSGQEARKKNLGGEFLCEIW